jgi:Raf kinase inhibitor-like YbhB/YbcL family protein
LRLATAGLINDEIKTLILFPPTLIAILLPVNKHTIATMSAPFPYNPYDSLPEASKIEVSSTDISEGGTVPAPHLSKAFGVEGGEDVSPQLSWSGAPEGTKSFVVSLYDPDAPTVSGFWHWVCYDIPASVTSLPTGAGNPDKSGLPEGAKMLKNDAGFAGFCGAAPPPGHGTHRYIFCVSALPVENLPIDENTSPCVSQFNMFGAGVLGRGFLTATFGR